ncbi:MAG: hypothetical protein GY751_25865 [Bacteroidetes bacterium]|nr:hypothetical protein [Bacteroidota bacterium]
MNSRKKAKEKKLGKGKPKQQPTAPTGHGEARPPEPTLEDLIGEIFGGEKKPTAPAAPVKPVVDPIDVQEFQHQQMLAEQAERAEKRALERKQQIAEQHKKLMNVNLKKKLTKDSGTIQKRIYGNVSLKDAIIAEAILDRPYK